jgi:hypothetical protein
VLDPAADPGTVEAAGTEPVVEVEEVEAFFS